MRRISLSLPLMMCLAVGWLCVGCAPEAVEPTPVNKPPVAADDLEHVHDEAHVHPDTYAGAITALEGIRDEVKEAFGKGEPAAADESVHEMGHLLEDLGNLAKKASLSEADQMLVNESVEKLLDAFGKIDAKLHGGEGSDYDQVSADIDSAFETLKKFVAAN